MNEHDTTTNTPAEPSGKDRFINFIMKHKLSVFLFLCLVVVFSWLTIKNSSQQKQFQRDKSELITLYKYRVDSLKVEHLKFATEVFSWSVRSELMRDNTENLNQLLTVFVQQSGADLVQIVHPTSNLVLISSDKKFEGSESTESDLANLTQTRITNQEQTIKIVTPVMGFNDKIGVLLVESQSNP
ncbi:MAG: hypothetical protein ACK4RM_10585 [Flavobacterium sp.]